MFIVLSNLPEGKHMPDTQNIETTTTVPEQSDIRRAAVIEAAYILEAVRK